MAGAGAAALAGVATACSRAADDASLAEGDMGAAGAADSAALTAAVSQPIRFAAQHQQGVLVPPAAAGMVAAFDVIEGASLAEVFEALSAEIARLMAGTASVPTDDFLPPVDSGAIGSEGSTAGVAITVAVGSSLFDTRFGLRELRPTELVEMPRFRNDSQIRRQLSHGDLAVTISAPNHQVAAFALQQLVRVTARKLQLRWVQDGYNQLLATSPDQPSQTRNLMGFREGSSNLDTSDATAMTEHVWVQRGDDEPDWAVGGSYQAVRIIRMLIEFWATAALVRQEQIFGRHRDSGAPLGQLAETDVPSFVDDPSDDTIPLRSHIRLANPRTPNIGRMLRRGFSYTNGVDLNGNLDQGLLFLAYQRSFNQSFLAAQTRLDGEPLEDYVRPVGGGLFFVVPGPGDDGLLGRGLF